MRILGALALVASVAACNTTTTSTAPSPAPASGTGVTVSGDVTVGVRSGPSYSSHSGYATPHGGCNGGAHCGYGR
ncbi:hypothetical protein ACS3QZ_08745 [Shimia sp. W99]